MRCNAVITAGGPIAGEYARMAGTSLKALAPVRGRTMLDRTIDALREIGVENVAVVGNDEVGRVCASRVERVVADTGSGAGNVLAALDAWRGRPESLLYLTCDMPYIEAASLRAFVASVDAETLAMPLTEYRDFAARFPQAPPGGIVLSGEHVVNGGVFHVPARASERVRDLAAALFDARKKPWRMATIVGPAYLALFAMRRLSVERLERRAREVVRAGVRAVRGSSPELAYDADTADDYRYACAHP
jgi:CTP:molybdopterin cytidylyltransferase MocA